MLTILYGEMGIGKTTVGKALAKHLDVDFFDGDDLLPQNLLDKIKKNIPLTTSEVEEYVIKYITPFLKGERNLVFAQALYRRKHRQYIQKELLLAKIPHVFVQIKYDKFWNHIKQLWSRPHGFRWILMAMISKAWFEGPKGDDKDLFFTNHHAPSSLEQAYFLLSFANELRRLSTDLRSRIA